jgi:hypothetical protein
MPLPMPMMTSAVASFRYPSVGVREASTPKPVAISSRPVPSATRVPSRLSMTTPMPLKMTVVTSSGMNARPARVGE